MQATCPHCGEQFQVTNSIEKQQINGAVENLLGEIWVPVGVLSTQKLNLWRGCE